MTTPLQNTLRKSPDQRRREAAQRKTARAIIGALIICSLPVMWLGCPAITLWVMGIGQ